MNWKISLARSQKQSLKIKIDLYQSKVFGHSQKSFYFSSNKRYTKIKVTVEDLYLLGITCTQLTSLKIALLR